MRLPVAAIVLERRMQALGFPHALCPHRHPYSIKVGLMRWLTSYAFGSHSVDWLALAVFAVLTFVVRSDARSFIVWLLKHKRGTGKAEKEYWSRHGGE
jgi:hypothetical protein